MLCGCRKERRSADGADADTQVVWTTSDESIATVDANGEVSCVGEGRVEIKTALVKDNAEVASDTFTFVVDLADPLSVYVNDIANFTFDNEESGFSSEGAKAVAGSESTMLADLLAEDTERGSVLQLERGKAEFLNVVAEDDSSLLTGVTDMKVSFDWKTNDT